MKVHHLNCVKIESPFGSAVGHCTLIESPDGLLTLIDAGIGMAETKEPEKKLGKEFVELTGFHFDESLTAIKQIKQLGLNPDMVSDIVCSHLDPDHIGGAADFPKAKLHISTEEYNAFRSGDERYLTYQLDHNPEIQLYENDDKEWYDLPARQLNLALEAYLIPLFGHTAGHCGIAYKIGDNWAFYAGDAYYLRAELEDKNHPVDQLATIRAVDNSTRIDSLNKVRKLVNDFGNEIDYYGYHDPLEFHGEIT